MRWLTRTALVFFLLFSFSIRFSQVAASSLIGTHLGEGDVGTQISIIQNVLVQNGLEPGSPVTVMINANSVANPNEQDVNRLADAVNGAGYFPIVRVMSVCERFERPPAEARQVVERIRSAFGPEAIIVWGNEVNNAEKECQNGSLFVQQWNAIAGMPNVVPAPLDLYNANFPADTFVGIGAYTGLTQAAGNAYGCEGASAESCPVEVGGSFDCTAAPISSYTKGYQRYGASSLYLTEFSLFPVGGNPAPDTDLNKVSSFIEQCGPATGALKITPLVRNVCRDAAGEWLLYINGAFYDRDGGRINPDNCETKASTLNLADYLDYEIEEDQYYLQAILGLTDGSAYTTGERNYKDIRQDLIAQGYEARCAIPSTPLKPEITTNELLTLYHDLYPNPQPEFEALSRQVLSVESIRAPLFRHTSDKLYLTSSFETYFGFKDVFNPDESTSELTTAPINSLLTHRQRCAQSAEMLASIYNMCTKLESEGDCGLRLRPIPQPTGDTSPRWDQMTVATLDGLYQEYATSIGGASYLDGGGGIMQFCNSLIDDPQMRDSPLYWGMQNLPLYLDQNYRLAFLIAAIETRPSDGTFFNFFTRGWSGGEPKHEVMAVAFKIPDIGTNKGTLNEHSELSGERGGSIDYPDPILTTRDTLLTSEQQKLLFDRREASRAALYQRALSDDPKNSPDFQNSDSEIYCLNGSTEPLSARTGSPACKDHLTKALVDIINLESDGCAENSEVVRLLGSSGALGDAESIYRAFKAAYGDQLLNELFLEGGGIEGIEARESSQSDTREFVTEYFINDTSRQGSTSMAFYLVYPVGFELEYVTSVLERSFFTDEQLALLESDPNRAQLLDAIGGSTAFSGGTVNHPFPNTRGPKVCGDPPGSAYCDEEFSITIEKEEGGTGFGFLGGYLGHWMRSSQLALNSVFSDTYAYIRSCTTTEEFLTGNCAGGTNLSTGAGACKDIANSEIEVFSMDVVKSKVCAAAAKHKIDPQLLYGILQIEGSPYLRAVNAGRSTTTCGPISVCGAMGPMQIINGGCTSAACPANVVGLTDRDPNQICTLDGALDWAGAYLSQQRSYLRQTPEYKTAIDKWGESQLLHMMAGRYHGLSHEHLISQNCSGAKAVQGCNSLNYCECAVNGWDFSCP